MGKKAIIISLLTVGVIAVSASGALTYFLVLKDPQEKPKEPGINNPTDVDKQESDSLSTRDIEFNSTESIKSKVNSLISASKTSDNIQIKDSLNDLVFSINPKLKKVINIYDPVINISDSFFNEESFSVKYYKDSKRTEQNIVTLTFINKDYKLLNETYFNKDYDWNEVININSNPEEIVKILNKLTNPSTTVQDKPIILKELYELVPKFNDILNTSISDNDLSKLNYQYDNIGLNETTQIQNIINTSNFKFRFKINESYKELSFSFSYIDYLDNTFNQDKENRTVQEKDITKNVNSVTKNYMSFIDQSKYMDLEDKYNNLAKDNTSENRWNFLKNTILKNNYLNFYKSDIINNLSNIIKVNEEIEKNWDIDSISKNIQYLSEQTQDNRIPELIKRHLKSWLVIKFKNKTNNLLKHPEINLQILLVDNNVDISNKNIDPKVFDKFKNINWSDKFSSSFYQLSSFKIEENKFIPVFSYSYKDAKEFNENFNNTTKIYTDPLNNKYTISKFLYNTTEKDEIIEDKYIQYLKTNNNQYIQINLLKNEILAPLKNQYILSFNEEKQRSLLQSISKLKTLDKSSKLELVNQLIKLDSYNDIGIKDEINSNLIDNITFSELSVDNNIASFIIKYKENTDQEQSKKISIVYEKDSFYNYLSNNSEEFNNKQTIYINNSKREEFFKISNVKTNFLSNEETYNFLTNKDNVLNDIINLKKDYSNNSISNIIPNYENINNKFSFTYSLKTNIFFQETAEITIKFVDELSYDLYTKNQFFSSWYYDNNIDGIDKDNIAYKNFSFNTKDNSIFNVEITKLELLNNLIDSYDFRINSNYNFDKIKYEIDITKLEYSTEEFSASIYYEKDGNKIYLFKYNFINSDYNELVNIFEDTNLNDNIKTVDSPQFIIDLLKDTIDSSKIEKIENRFGYSIDNDKYIKEINFSKDKNNFIEVKYSKNQISRKLIIKLDFEIGLLLNSNFLNSNEITLTNDNFSSFDIFDNSSELKDILIEWNKIADDSNKISELENYLFIESFDISKQENQIIIKLISSDNNKEYSLIINKNIVLLNPNFLNSNEITLVNFDKTEIESKFDTIEGIEIINKYNEVVPEQQRIFILSEEEFNKLYSNPVKTINERNITISFNLLSDSSISYNLVLEYDISEPSNYLERFFSKLPEDTSSTYASDINKVSINYFLDQKNKDSKQNAVSDILDLLIDKDEFNQYSPNEYKDEFKNESTNFSIISLKINQLISSSGFKFSDSDEILVIKEQDISSIQQKWKELLDFSDKYNFFDNFVMRFDDIYTSINKPYLILKYQDSDTTKEDYLLVEFNNVYSDNLNNYIQIDMNNNESTLEIRNINSNKEIVNNLINSLEDNNIYKLIDNKNNLLDTWDEFCETFSDELLLITKFNSLDKNSDLYKNLEIQLDYKYINDDKSTDLESLSLKLIYRGFVYTYTT